MVSWVLLLLLVTIGTISYDIMYIQYRFLALCHTRNVSHRVLLSLTHRGPDWGMNGYIWMSRNDNNQCGVACDATYALI